MTGNVVCKKGVKRSECRRPFKYFHTLSMRNIKSGDCKNPLPLPPAYSAGSLLSNQIGLLQRMGRGEEADSLTQKRRSKEAAEGWTWVNSFGEITVHEPECLYTLTLALP